MTTMRAQEDSGIWEELKTYGINKEKFYREKEIAAISVAASMLWLVGTTKEKKMLACLQSVLHTTIVPRTCISNYTSQHIMQDTTTSHMEGDHEGHIVYLTHQQVIEP
jgi:hypothetical protein